RLRSHTRRGLRVRIRPRWTVPYLGRGQRRPTPVQDLWTMSIPVTCQHCQASFKVKDELAGKRARCPRCTNVLTIPAPGGGPPGAAASARPAETTAAAPALGDLASCDSAASTGRPAGTVRAVRQPASRRPTPPP